MCPEDENIGRLDENVDRQRVECPTNQAERPLFPIFVHALQLPDDDHGRENLDYGVQPEARERHRPGRDRRRDDDAHPNDIPAERRVFKAQPALQQCRLDDYSPFCLAH